MIGKTSLVSGIGILERSFERASGWVFSLVFVVLIVDGVIV